MANLLGAASGFGGDTTSVKKKIMTQEEGRLADLAAMSGKKKALTKEQIDSAAGKFDRKNWVGSVAAAGYIPTKGN